MRAFARYRAVLTLPGARGPVAASILGSLPIGMFGLAILLLTRDATGSYALAGRVAGAFGLANAIGAVAQGRLMDRLGQTRVLRPTAAVHLAAVGALVAVAEAGASTAVMALAAAAGGLTLPQVPAAMRSLWGELTTTAAERQTAYALVSITFEVASMTGAGARGRGRRSPARRRSRCCSPPRCAAPAGSRSRSRAPRGAGAASRTPCTGSARWPRSGCARC